jgi:ABC-type multidrug transport system ATPase subunit
VPDPAIVASEIAFGWERAGPPLIDRFSLEVKAGEVVALLGENGAGKTTILRILSGDLRPRAGRVAILSGDPAAPATRRRMGVLREAPVLNPYLTARESARYTLAIFGAPRAQSGDLDGALRTFGLDTGKKRVKAFSKGMMRRLELLQLRLVDPPVWILDEPDSGLDPGGARLFRHEVGEARARGRAVLFSSHSVLDAALCADRVIVMRRGRIAFAGTREETMARLDERAFVAAGGGPDLAAALAAAAAAAGATLRGPEIPLASLEDLLFEDAGP